MALKPEQISGLREAFSAIAQPINDWLLQDAAERIAAAGSLAGEPAGKMTATAAYEIYRAKALGESQRELKKFLKRQLGLSNREIRRLFKQAARMSRDNDEERVGLTGGADIEQMTAAAIKLAQQDFTNLTQTLGMMAPGGKVLPLRQFYQKSMDFAFEQIFTGAADYETAIRQATTKMADAGVRTINYESGRSTSLEAAVRRNMMGGMGLLDEQITQANHDALGCNGWEISAHANSAPDHEPIQGRQYSDREFKTLESRLVRRIGTLNCGHVKMPILLGINSPQYTEEQLRAFQEDNAKGITYEGKHYTGYEATQKQRQLECAQRVQKNRILVSRSTGDALREQTAQIRLQILSQHYKAFSKAAGLPLQQERTWVAGFGAKGTAGFLKEEVKDAGTKQYAVNWKAIRSEAYERKFSKVTSNEIVNQSAYNHAKWMLRHRNGVNTEELYVLNLDTGEEILKVLDQHYPGAIKRTRHIDKVLREANKDRIKLLFMHNHPKGNPPSRTDINTLMEYPGSLGLTIGYDGNVYLYSAPNKNISEFDYAVAMRKYKDYTEITGEEKGLESLVGEYDFKFTKL